VYFWSYSQNGSYVEAPHMNTNPIDRAGAAVIEVNRGDVTAPAQSSSKAASAATPRFQLRRILVPLDFSECSQKALQYALPFARQFGAELFLLHVVRPYVTVIEMAPVEMESAEEAQEGLDKLQAMTGTGVASRTLIRTGTPYYEITTAAKEFDIDLIILSTHGRSGLAHVLMGSTTDKVVRHAGCPVLIVREHEHEFIVGGPEGA
jgi:universal stress protein A